MAQETQGATTDRAVPVALLVEPSANLPDPKAEQELKNLQLTSEKLLLEITELRRPYLMRNPQLVAVLTGVLGAIISTAIYVNGNYLKLRKCRTRCSRLKPSAWKPGSL